MAEFKLSNETLRRMMAHMSRNMDKGLEGGPEKSTVSMLPSFVPELPSGTDNNNING
ncbi:unnamed protein product [Onchocerca flexuosa]|uniref:Hexokinase_1 domain-containing protein n=1 Tax=Onchocerca flexuosa TaxID=387005 RepID=A0A183HUW6_9BILA|nr:unnamed protein product [Onchocerca flexuosa]